MEVFSFSLRAGGRPRWAQKREVQSSALPLTGLLVPGLCVARLTRCPTVESPVFPKTHS